MSTNDLNIPQEIFDEYNGDLDEDEAFQLALLMSQAEQPAAGAGRTAGDTSSEVQPSPSGTPSGTPPSSAPDADVAASDDSEAAATVSATAPRLGGSNWAEIMESLMVDYAMEQKSRMAKEALKKKARLEEPMAAVERCPEPFRRPRLQERRGLSELQTESLLIARYVIYKRLTAREPRGELTGHGVAATINELNMPISLKDSVLMLKVAAGTSLVEENAGRQTLFADRFEQLARLARWPDDDDDGDLPAAGAAATGGAAAGARAKLPAHDLEHAPQEYYRPLPWPTWCRVFDHVALRVQKNGMVW